MKKTTKATKKTIESSTKIIRVWTACYRWAMMGGNVYQPIAAEVEAQGPFDLGKGYKGYVVTSPKGQTHIAESQTGAFIGTSLKEVQKDIKTGDPKVMKKQIADAKVRSEKAQNMTTERFWSLFV